MDETGQIELTRAEMESRGWGRGVTNALLVQRAWERDVEVSLGDRLRLELRHGGRSAWFRNGGSSLNTRLAIRCTKSKDVTSRLLRSRGVSAPENCVFSGEELSRAWSWAQPVLPVVVKPVDSAQGRLVTVDVSDFDEFRRAFTEVAAAKGQVLVERFVSGVEHRVAVIGGKFVAATRRVPAHVVGDGSSSIEALVARKNRDRLERQDPIHESLQIGAIELRQLARQGWEPRSVPGAGVVVALRATSNLHTGGDAVDATDDFTAEEIESVERAARAIPGLRLGGFDVLLDRVSGAEPCILEINTSPMLSMHHFPWAGQPRDVVTRVLEMMFPGLRREAMPAAVVAAASAD